MRHVMLALQPASLVCMDVRDPELNVRVAFGERLLGIGTQRLAQLTIRVVNLDDRGRAIADHREVVYLFPVFLVRGETRGRDCEQTNHHDKCGPTWVSACFCLSLRFLAHGCFLVVVLGMLGSIVGAGSSLRGYNAGQANLFSGKKEDSSIFHCAPTSIAMVAATLTPISCPRPFS